MCIDQEIAKNWGTGAYIPEYQWTDYTDKNVAYIHHLGIEIDARQLLEDETGLKTDSFTVGRIYVSMNQEIQAHIRGRGFSVKEIAHVHPDYFVTLPKPGEKSKIIPKYTWWERIREWCGA